MAATSRRAGAAVVASWGPDLEKQQWHHGALTAGVAMLRTMSSVEIGALEAEG
jgi:hypothetical protein